MAPIFFKTFSLDNLAQQDPVTLLAPLHCSKGVCFALNFCSLPSYILRFCFFFCGAIDAGRFSLVAPACRQLKRPLLKFPFSPPLFSFVPFPFSVIGPMPSPQTDRPTPQPSNRVFGPPRIRHWCPQISRCFSFFFFSFLVFGTLSGLRRGSPYCFFSLSPPPLVPHNGAHAPPGFPSFFSLSHHPFARGPPFSAEVFFCWFFGGFTPV